MSTNIKYPKEIIILARGRAGTSLTASLLHGIGVHMGDRLKEASDYNKWGYWENEDFTDFNVRILKETGVSFRNFHIEKLDIPKYHKEAKLIIDRNKKDRIWGWKAGRNIFTIRLFLKYLKNPHFIVVNREIYNHTKSSAKVHGGSEAKNMYNILKCYEEIERFFDEFDLPRLDVSYERLRNEVPNKRIDTQDVELREMAKFVGIEMNDKLLIELKNMIHV